MNKDFALNDPEISDALNHELIRQQTQIELIASENIVSQAVLAAQGSIMTNKYAEGYPAHRYYGGCEFVDMAEKLAIQRATQLFNCAYANVQPHSGAQANMAVFFALLKPGDTIMGMSLAAGGHLTHGAPPTFSGKWFKAIGYGVREDNHQIDYTQVAELARAHRPQLMIAGGSSYARIIDFSQMRAIADEVGAILMVDMAHFAGLVAAGYYPNPLDFAHVVTSTTHKTLRGPRGGLILTTSDKIIQAINKAVFPGIQGGPLMHVIAAKAVAFKEALSPSFKIYTKQIIDNAKSLADSLVLKGYDIVSKGTDTHLFLVDLTNKQLTGKDAEASLENAGITCNKNAIPFDPLGVRITSGLRLGTPAITTRGFQQTEMVILATFIDEVLKGLKQKGPANNYATEQEVKVKVEELCKHFPIYNHLNT